jgi:hypothetical protein
MNRLGGAVVMTPPFSVGQRLATKNGKKAYTGILAEPMPKYMALAGPIDEEIGTLIDSKFKALFAHYEIDSAEAFQGGPKMAATWANLAWHLAREHVPGFSDPPRTRGRPATRKSDDVTLFMHVELLKRRDGLSERKAIKKIHSENVIPGTGEVILKRYNRAKPQFRPMSAVFDNMVDHPGIGKEGFVRALEGALSGDEKETFLSPD